MEELNHTEIINLKDDKLKLRYILGGLISYGKEEPCNRYWSCDIKCSSYPVPEDDNLNQIIALMQAHNLDITALLEIAYSYIRNGFYPYNGENGLLIEEIADILKAYHFDMEKQNDPKEVVLCDQEILQFIQSEAVNPHGKLYEFLNLYHLTTTDFIVLAKTKLNYGFYKCHGFIPSEFYQKLNTIVKENLPYESYEKVEELKNNKQIIKAKKRK